FSHLVWRFRNAETGFPGARDPIASPCIFCQVHGPNPTPNSPANGSEEIRNLLLAENWLGAKSGKRKDGVEMIATLLRSYHPGSDWSRAHYGALAVKASIAEGDLQKAKNVLELALKFEPQDPQLQYLTRIITRAEGGQMADAKGVKLSSK